MNKLIPLLLACVLTTAAMAQDNTVIVLDDALGETSWFGVSTGFPLGATFHYGLDDFIGEVDTRFNGAFALSSAGGETGVGLSLGADALFGIDVDTEQPINVYVGGGPTVALSIADEVGFGLGLNAVAGAEYRFDEFGVFAEASFGYVFGTNFDPAPALRIGGNYHF